MKLLLISALCLPLVSGAAELTIPEEPAFTEPAPLPPAQLPEGRLHKPVSPEWGCRSLDGEWRFRKVPFVKGRDERNDEGIRDRLFAAGVDDAGWERITVPGSWWLHNGWDASPGKLGYYRRTFEIKPEETGPNRRVILDFRRVSDRADVWVNGKSAGEPHFGRAASFQYDIGALVKPGKNELAVRVYDYQGGSTGWRAHIGGICDGVRLLTLPGGCFVSGAMITPDLKSGTVAIQVRTIAPQPGRGLTAEIVDPESDTAVASRQFGGFAVPAGTGWSELGTVAIPSPRLWTPGDPFRYVLRLRDPAGNTVGFEPFGFREFKAEGEWLMLNGRKFKPRMFTYTTQWVRRVHNNIGHSSERLLRMMKDQLHVNMIRPHSMDGTPFEGLYEICDRIGMLVYFDWSGPGGHQAYDKKWNDSILEAAPELEAFIRDNYNRPCLAMWSLGNEIYEGHYNLYFSQNLDKLYGMVKKLDRQNRPVCSSSGRQSLEALQSGLLKERTDVADDHQYRGSYCGSWQENIGHITYYAQVARHHFNRPIPKIDAEYGVPGDCARYRGDLTQQAVAAVLAMPRDTAAFKEAYAKMLRDPRPEVGGYLRLLSNYATPDDYAAKKPLYRKYGFRYAKRPIEIYRRAGVECLGGHTNIQWYDLVREFPDGYHVADLPQAPPEEWRVMPPFYWIARCYNPTLVSAGVFNQQPYAGRDEKAEVFVTNDLNEDGDFEVVPQFRLESGTVITLPALKFGTVPAMGQKSLILEYRTPDCRRIERGRLELYLFRDGRRVGDNCYDLSIFPARKTGLPARCALYDSAGAKFRGLLKTPTTTGVLRQLGCRAHRVGQWRPAVPLGEERRQAAGDGAEPLRQGAVPRELQRRLRQSGYARDLGGPGPSGVQVAASGGDGQLDRQSGPDEPFRPGSAGRGHGGGLAAGGQRRPGVLQGDPVRREGRARRGDPVPAGRFGAGARKRRGRGVPVQPAGILRRAGRFKIRDGDSGRRLRAGPLSGGQRRIPFRPLPSSEPLLLRRQSRGPAGRLDRFRRERGFPFDSDRSYTAAGRSAVPHPRPGEEQRQFLHCAERRKTAVLPGTRRYPGQRAAEHDLRAAYRDVCE